MAGNVTNWAWDHSGATNGPLIVLLAIAREANRDGEAEIGAAELAAKCRLGERAVRSAVSELVAAGKLDASRRGGRGHLTRYRALMGNPAESAPFTELNPAESAAFEPETRQNLPPSDPVPVELNPAESAAFNGHPGRPEPDEPVKGADSAPLQISDMLVSSTGSEEVQVKDVPAIAERADVERLCAHLADSIAANGSKRPAISKKWRDAARLMIDRDGRAEQQVRAAIDWCQADEFWRANILSMPKLREKYDQLRLQAGRKQAGSNGTAAIISNARARAMARENGQ